MTDDYTKEIRERLECIQKKMLGPAFDDISLSEAYEFDITNLLKEREVLRKALERYADRARYFKIGYARWQTIEVIPGNEANKALAWKPTHE